MEDAHKRANKIVGIGIARRSPLAMARFTEATKAA